MAGCCRDFCSPFSFKLLLVVLFVVLQSLDVFITAKDQNGWVAKCQDEAVSSWRPYWYPSSNVTNGTKCNIQCPLNCSCSLGNYNEVISKCSNRSLTIAHVSYPPNVTHLSWAHNKLCNISKNSFAGLADTLQDIHLNNNSLQYLEPGVFECLNKLVLLDLRHNLLQEIDDETFGGLTNLALLDLDYNMLKEIRPDGFKDLGNLKILFLDKNLLQVVQPCAFNRTGNLSKLYMSYNMMKEIQSGAFEDLGNLTFLALENNILKEIQPGAFNGLGNLSELYMKNNMLKEIQLGTFEELKNLLRLGLHSNALEEIPGAFKGLVNLSELDLSDNMLKEIQPGAFEGIGNLSVLNLQNNLLKVLQPDAFKGIGNLTVLSLYGNMLKEIQPGAFNGLVNLSTLYLPNNMLKEIQPGAFEGLGNLSRLELNGNMLEEIQAGVFSGLEGLQYLPLHSNMLTKLLPSVLGKLINLVLLDLRHNPLAPLHPDIFHNLSSLDALILGNISLTFLPLNIFQALKQLRHLDLSANKLQELRFQPFEFCIILETLNLTQNPLQWINKDAFTGLNVTAEVFVDDPASCCFVTKANCWSSSTQSPFLTCGRMLPYDVLRVGIWVVSIIAVVSNVISILAKYKQRKHINKVQFLLITNLSISDLLMGVYLIILLSVDLYYTDYFPSHSDSWRNSTLCKVTGSLSVLSSEASVFFITVISIDRAIAIKFPFRAHRGSTKSTCIIVSFLWLVASGISITSFVLTGMDSDVYAVSEICVGLPISRQYTYNISETSVQLTQTFENVIQVVQENKATGSQAAMYFSIAIFTALNLFCFIIVGLCYLTIFITATKTTEKSGRSRNLKEDIQMAKKMFLLVLTDFCCWVPIGVLSILVQAGAVEVHPIAYAWIATFILPINSSINPFLYTLGDVIADKVSCSCKKCKDQSSDENTEMISISRPK